MGTYITDNLRMQTISSNIPIPACNFFRSNFKIFNLLIAPTSSTNPEDEDIDIVGCEGDNSTIGNKTNTSGNLSSSESSRDLQLHVYGPPQFTEADVVACILVELCLCVDVRDE